MLLVRTIVLKNLSCFDRNHDFNDETSRWLFSYIFFFWLGKIFVLVILHENDFFTVALLNYFGYERIFKSD